ncbi:hypothetical protein, partial [Bifidobacterium adolescentis]|uniref:hypothetical protein n=1 Tax=Bifidobacterium adolescentis TaxID=1680 RepID=UPI003D798977
MRFSYPQVYPLATPAVLDMRRFADDADCSHFLRFLRLFAMQFRPQRRHLAFQLVDAAHLLG